MESAVDDPGDAVRQSARERCALALVLVLILVVAVAAGARPAVAGTAPPNQCADVDLAQVRNSDRNPDGTRISQKPDARGKYIPIVMVHGWTSSSTHGPDGAFSHIIDLTALNGQKFRARASLIGQLQRISGAAVYTFDYHRDSAKWVTNDNLGPRLGRAIDCLYATTGEKAILVAHSMGGLVSRFAASQPGPSGNDRAAEISRIITFGTPQTGSDLANTVAGGLDASAVAGAAIAQPVTPGVRLLLAYCGALTTKALETGTLCDFLPDFVQAFDTEAGRGLQTGSRELRELKPVPSGIALNALAGDVRISGTEGWFGSPRIGEYHAGDVIVPVASATANATTERTVQCRYQLDVSHWGADRLLVAIGQKSNLDVAPMPLHAFTGACFHTSLMRTVQLTTEVLGLVSDDLAARVPEAPQEPAQGADPQAAAVPICRDWVAMSADDRDEEVRTLLVAHRDSTNFTLSRLSVRAFCELNPGRRIDGVYAPGSRSPSAGGGDGPIPTCEEWREMGDEEADAAILRAARGHESRKMYTLRLLTAGYCEIRRDQPIDGIYGGG